MFSDNVHFWNEHKLVLKPTFAWELIQIGNCGSPIETDAGWLVLSHGVGPLRKYSIGAFLLDLNDPGKVIGRLRELRAAKEWSQGDLAEKLGASRQTINAIETEKYDPSLPLAFKVARLFRKPIEEIFDDNGN